MTEIQLSEIKKQFLIELFERTKGNLSVKASMYDVGESLGMDRDTSSKSAEELISWGLVEVKTLSGAISITEAGISEARMLKGDSGGYATLGKDVILKDENRQSVETILASIKSKTGNSGLDYDDLSELVADMKTIEAQLGSPKPKTAIIRECFISAYEVLKKSNLNELSSAVQGLLS